MSQIFWSIAYSIGFISECLTISKINQKQDEDDITTVINQNSLSMMGRLSFTMNWTPSMSDFFRNVNIKSEHRLDTLSWEVSRFLAVTFVISCDIRRVRNLVKFFIRAWNRKNATSTSEMTDIPANNPISPPIAPKKSELPKAFRFTVGMK